MYRHSHPVMVLTQLQRFVFILIIPAARGFFSALFGDFWAWLTGAWVDVGALLLIVLLAVWRWRRLTYRLDAHGITLRSGLFARRETFLFWDNIATVTTAQPFYLRPFHVVYLRADTLGGSSRRTDLALYVTQRESRAFLRGQDVPIPCAPAPQPVYAPGTVPVLLMALLTSRSLTEVLYLSTFVSQAGKLLGAEFSRLLLSSLWDISHRLAFGIPPLAAAIAYVLLGGWALGLLFTLVRYRHYTVAQHGAVAHIHSGGITRRQYALQLPAVNFIDIRRNIALYALKLHSLYISVPGFGKGRDEIACLLPAEPPARFTTLLRQFFPAFVPLAPTVRPARSSVLSFLGLPLFLCTLLLALAAVAVRLFAAFQGFILFICLMLLVPAALFLALRFLAWRTGGVSFADAHYTLCYSSIFILHTVVVPASKITALRLYQSPFQLLSGRNCHLVFYTMSEKRTRHMCRSLPRAQAEALLQAWRAQS